MNKAAQITTVQQGGTNESVKPKVKVWLVDDNDQVRMLVGELLEREKDIECARHFSGPDELLSTLASKPGPDVILLDVQMGERNGLDAVRPIKSLAPRTRVLMFTTCFDREWRERALREGASDYLLKSYEMTKVAARIRCPALDAGPASFPQRRANQAAVQATVEKSSLLSRALVMLRALRN